VRGCSDRIVGEIKLLTGALEIDLAFKHVLTLRKRTDEIADPCESVVDEPRPCKLGESFENESLKKALELLKAEIQNAA
jgi:hypothetical protein